MKFLKINLNEAVLIDDSFFVSKKSLLNNIDYLNNSLSNEDNFEIFNELCSTEIDDIVQKQLIIISRAANLAEKFHSFFHFEEAYFHFFYANFLLKIDFPDNEKIIYHFENSIKQFRFDQFVHLKLIQFCKDRNLETKMIQSIQRFESLFNSRFKEGLIKNFETKRQFDSFEKYIQFAIACSENEIQQIQNKIQEKFLKTKNFYNTFDNFLMNYDLHFNKEELMKKAENSILMIELAHSLYHQNAAKIYYNYSMIYKILGQEIQSKNLMNKVKNLSPNFILD